jgi:hypothetical protein
MIVENLFGDIKQHEDSRVNARIIKVISLLPGNDQLFTPQDC